MTSKKGFVTVLMYATGKKWTYIVSNFYKHFLQVEVLVETNGLSSSG